MCRLLQIKETLNDYKSQKWQILYTSTLIFMGNPMLYKNIINLS